jgi:hypothetical protein
LELDNCGRTTKNVYVPSIVYVSGAASKFAFLAVRANYSLDAYYGLKMRPISASKSSAKAQVPFLHVHKNFGVFVGAEAPNKAI